MILGITGPARSGKDTIANRLVSKCCYARQSFADPARHFVAGLLGMHFADLVGGPLGARPIEWLDGKSPRDMLQALDTQWGHDLIHPELWVRAAMRKARQTLVLQPRTTVVFADVRVASEARAIRAAGGIILHVTRPGAEAVRAHTDGQGVTEHAHDLHLRNDGSMESLLASTDSIARCVGLRRPLGNDALPGAGNGREARGFAAAIARRAASGPRPVPDSDEGVSSRP